MVETAEVYKHSGKWGSGLVIIPVVAIVASLVFSLAYGYADVYSPVAGYLSVLLVVIFGIAVGASISRAAVSAKCRSKGLVALVSFLAALLSLYASWAVFVYACLQRLDEEPLEVSLVEMFLSPGAIWEAAKVIAETGWYSIRGLEPKGIVLWIFWTLEAGIIVVTVMVAAQLGISSRVFCERCGVWCRHTKNLFRLGLPDDPETLQRLKDGDIAVMKALPIVAAAHAPSLRVDLHQCELCNDTTAMELKQITLKEEKGGKTSEKDEDFSPCFLLTRAQWNRVQEMASSPPPDQTAGSVTPSA